MAADLHLSPRSSRPRSSCPRLVCDCGNIVLFPGGLSKRTCMNCGAILHVEDTENHGGSASPRRQQQAQATQEQQAQIPHLQPMRSGDSAATLLQPQSISSAQTTTELQRPRFLDSAGGPSVNASPSGSRSSFVLSMSPRIRNILLWVFLILSLVLNAGIFPWQHLVKSHMASPQARVTNESPLATAYIDADADGIPDHHDMCTSCSGAGALCPPKGWKSGRATDFDSDGCADGIEDKDKDNDGVLDSLDKCPFTPQKLVFVSNVASDFDGDGCADGVEDNDDDNDSIPNTVDVCPSTAGGETADSKGCSSLQHESRAGIAAQAPASPPLTQQQQVTEEEKKPKPKPSRVQSWITAVHHSGIEVVIGAILAVVFGRMHQKAHEAKNHVHENHVKPVIDHVHENHVKPAMASIRRASVLGVPAPEASVQRPAWLSQ